MTEFKQTRLAIGASQLAVARAAAVSPSYLSLVETGYLHPPEQRRKKSCALCSASPHGDSVRLPRSKAFA